MSQGTIQIVSLFLYIFCISTTYFTNALIIGHTRHHTFKLAAAFIQSLVVSWIRPFFTVKMFLQGYYLIII